MGEGHPLPDLGDYLIPSQWIGNAVNAIADVLARGEPTLILLGSAGTREPSLLAASRVAVASGAELLCEVFPARQERGAGVPQVGRLAYLSLREEATKQLKGIQALVLLPEHARQCHSSPIQVSRAISFPEGCQVYTLATERDDVTATLQALADRVAPATATSSG